MTQQKPTGKIMLYGCGGAGLNISSHFETFRNKTEAGFAQIETVYVDTSRSNVTKEMNADSVYIFDGLDGSGKLRSENHQQIADSILDILQTHKPGDLNIVVSSGSGGSGSVIAPVLASELLGRGLCTVVLIVGSTDSRLELENTAKTLKSYEAISQMRDMPVAAMYYCNSKETPEHLIDSQIRTNIVLLSALFSRQNKRLDSSDLRNWLNYPKVTSYEPHLVYLGFYDDKIEIQKPGSVISVATLSFEGVDASPGIPVDYQCIGYVVEGSMATPKFEKSIHASIIDGVFTNIVKKLTSTLAELDLAKNARISNPGLLSDNDKPTKTGLVL